MQDVAQTQTPDQGRMQVDFAYAFATPHRLTVALPDSSDKTLLSGRATVKRCGVAKA